MQAVTVAEEEERRSRQDLCANRRTAKQARVLDPCQQISAAQKSSRQHATRGSVKLASLPAGDRKFGSIYNARGKFLKVQADRMGVKHADLAAVLMIESGNRGFKTAMAEPSSALRDHCVVLSPVGCQSQTDL